MQRNWNVLLSRPGIISTANMVVGLLIIGAVLFLVRDIVSLAVPVREQGGRSVKKTAQAMQTSLQDYAVILRNNPFGPPAGELQPLSSAAGPAMSQSDLILTGTISGPRRYSFAFIADKTGQQDVYRIGDKVLSLGKLERVEKDRVFIRADGRQMEIPLSDLTVTKELKPPSSAVAGLGRRTGESTFILDQQRVNQALERPDQLMTDARFVPNLVEGRQQGFLLREVKPGGIYASLGLQNGDVLLKINDFTISNPETALQAVTALRGIDRAQLDIVRQGSRLTMTYQIR